MGSQFDMFPEERKEEINAYTSKIKTPIYETSPSKPHPLALTDTRKYKKMLREIDSSDLPEEEKELMRLCATRHIVFNYSKIADYYAHSNNELQGLMEKSALVIIDMGKAIELGYVKLAENIANQYEY